MSEKGVVSNVHEIVLKLPSHEKAAVRAYLGLTNENRGAKPAKIIALFDYLDSLKADHGKADEEIEIIIYKTPNKVAFRRLLWRLREKILEVILFDINVERSGVYSERVKANIAVRKNVSQAQILQGWGLRKQAENILVRTVDLCEKYEMYHELLLALSLLIEQRVVENGDNELEFLLEKYKKYNFCQNAVLNAEVYYHKVHLDVELRSEGLMTPEVLRKILDDLSEDHFQSGSVQVAYYYYNIEAQYHQSLRNYQSAMKSLLNIKEIFDKGSPINIPCRIGGVLLNLADNDLYLCQFERAYVTAEEGMRSFHNGNFNYEQGIELQFYAKFYSGEYEVAINILSQAKTKVRNSNDFRKGKRAFLLANAFFMIKDYITVLKYLAVINPIESDREGWNLGVKILQIITLIEQHESDEATAKIDALRKFIESGETKNHRAQIICQILVSLTYNGFDFKEVFLTAKGLLEMLGEKSGALAWKIKSPEMVIFHQWFFAKTTKQPFELKLTSFQLERNKQKRKKTIIKQEKK